MKLTPCSIITALCLVAGSYSIAQATPTYLSSFESTYPAAQGSAIDDCTLCHASLSTYARNSFGSAYSGNGHSFPAIENMDSDQDGFTNIDEINALTFPGDASSHPAVTPVNHPPVANAGPDQTAVENDTVTLDGSNSNDPDNNIATYAWKQTTGPAVSLSNPASVQPTFTAPLAGASGSSLTFQLTVTDSGGLTSTDTCIVNITPATPANQPPVANAGPDQGVDSGTTVYLDASNSTDPDDGISSYLWKQTAGPAVTLSDPATVSPTFVSPAGGINGASMTFQLTVTDFGGLQSTDTCIININPDGTVQNQPPVADAGPDQTAISGTTVALDASNSSDSDDGIASVRWRQIAGPSVTLSDTTAVQPTFTAPAVGNSGASLTFQLTVTDTGGLTSSDRCTVQVTAASSGSTDSNDGSYSGDDDGGYHSGDGYRRNRNHRRGDGYRSRSYGSYSGSYHD